jgi:hypothetical protein
VQNQKIEGAATGLAKIGLCLSSWADELSRDQAKVRFMARLTPCIARHWPAERLLMLEAQIKPAGVQVLQQAHPRGHRDGSLRRDLNPEFTLHAVMNAVIGAQRRLASLGTRLSKSTDSR